MLTISDDERTHPLAMTRSRSLPAALTLRAKIVLGGGPAWCRPPYDWQWRNRFIADRIEGLSRCVAAGPARRG